MTAGRPSDYDESYCEKVIEFGEQGKSITWMAAELGVARQTIHNWAASHPEFLDALDRAMAKSQQWWEDSGQTNMMGQGFNASVWSKSMAARFPEDWRDNSKQEITGGLNNTIRVVFDD